MAARNGETEIGPWGVDGPALLARLEALDYAGCLAVLDAVERAQSSPLL